MWITNIRSLNRSSIICLKHHLGKTKILLSHLLGTKKDAWNITKGMIINWLGYKHHFILLGDLIPPQPLCPTAEKLSESWPTFLLHVIPFLFFLLLLFLMLSFYSGGLRLKTWDHAPSHPWLPLLHLLHSRFCWISVSCELYTLRHTCWQNPKLSAAPLSHTHDLNVTGENNGLLGVEGKEGAVTLSAIRPFTNHHWPP